eukprot:5431366-Prorocentrum_lima.AAC.1
MALIEKDPEDNTQTRIVDGVRQDLSATAPLNITGKASNACCFCSGKHFANNKFLFIDHENTIKN